MTGVHAREHALTVRVHEASFLPLPEAVRLTGRELGDESISTDDLRVRALVYARHDVQGHTVVNAPPGWAISVGRRGLNKGADVRLRFQSRGRAGHCVTCSRSLLSVRCGGLFGPA